MTGKKQELEEFDSPVNRLDLSDIPEKIKLNSCKLFPLKNNKGQARLFNEQRYLLTSLTTWAWSHSPYDGEIEKSPNRLSSDI